LRAARNEGTTPTVSDLGHHSRVEQWSAAELTVAADRRELDLFVDGEIHRLAPPIRFRTRPGTLQMVAPPPRGGMIGR
jgi:diacylglycerol kinase family enzyme